MSSTKCPICKNSISNNATYCPHCQTELHACPVCRRVFTKDVTFCERCELDFNSLDALSTVENIRKKDGFFKTFNNIFAVVLTVAIFGPILLCAPIIKARQIDFLNFDSFDSILNFILLFVPVLWFSVSPLNLIFVIIDRVVTYTKLKSCRCDRFLSAKSVYNISSAIKSQKASPTVLWFNKFLVYGTDNVFLSNPSYRAKYLTLEIINYASEAFIAPIIIYLAFVFLGFSVISDENILIIISLFTLILSAFITSIPKRIITSVKNNMLEKIVVECEQDYSEKLHCAEENTVDDLAYISEIEIYTDTQEDTAFIANEATYSSTVQDKSRVSVLAGRIQIYGIIGIIIGVLQICSIIFSIVGIWNVVTGIKNLRVSKKLNTHYVGLVNVYKPLFSPILNLLFNLIFGGVIGIILSLYYIFAIRGYVMENKDYFNSLR